LYIESDLSNENDAILAYLLSSNLYYSSMGRINRQEVATSLAPITSLLESLHRQRVTMYRTISKDTGHSLEVDEDISVPENVKD